MSPDEVDQAILAFCKPQFSKVARIIIDVATALEVPLPMERIFIDVPKAFKKPMGLEVDFIADRIKALVKAKKLESRGISTGGALAKSVCQRKPNREHDRKS
jgi:hypothetical protein